MREGVVHAGCFQQIHVDAARNATDDFNPFHDPHKWMRLAGNPFPGPLVLGFQLETLIEALLHRLPGRDDDDAWAAQHRLRWTNYELTFAGALCPGEEFSAEVRAGSRHEGTEPGIAHRVLIRKPGAPVLLGWVRRSAEALFVADLECDVFVPPLRAAPDRCQREDWFLKRKFASTGHAKNFLAGALADQAEWFDELEDRVEFPQMLPAALLSCALLEQARLAGHDFYAEPLVYTTHRLSVYAPGVHRIRSNDALHLLVHGPQVVSAGGGLGVNIEQQRYTGLVCGRDDEVLVRAEVLLAPLTAITRR
ncbi:hypothetical protein [Plasticicumulans acidivorans]|uniref:MaoC dehydratase-like protein n=1 Tax=Plasticicumulans acidivorans TaxID=886464 RepID=A0A317MZ18_9GAMM|nr:hypothetical protein [Plasticicumulans acidivorans]PWV64865.1 hypothetical protein C7443_102519 [Plasticicumulans acidivorans]